MELIGRATVIFFLIFLLTRGMPKRALAEMSPFEMILLVVLGDIVQQGITQDDASITGATLVAATFGFWITVLTWMSWRSKAARTIIEGTPVVLVHEGRPIDQALHMEKMPLAELLEAARQQGIGDLSKVRMAVLEPSGRISFIRQD